MPSWLTTVLLALLGALLPTQALAQPAAAPSPPSVIYTYDGLSHGDVLSYVTTERGPPATYDHSSTAYDAVDNLSHGAWARPDATAPPPAFAYGHPAPFAYVARAAPTAAEADEGAWLSVARSQRLQVAANAAPRTLDIGGGSFPGLTVKSIQRSPDGVISINPNIAHGPSVVGRSQQLPFADNSFSNVTMNHFPSDQFAGGTLAEVARVLRPGGTLSITTGRRADVGAILSELQGLGFSTRLGRAEGGIPWITGSLG